ncbi:hypothetical protein K7I13_10050 [Brucepastera parasyntrophica]|uniref:hypothetical protein n=1 Tax=Brucepastera parasyntrophica TaxID=2880008 RepID=UPI00210A22DE|nr:hypothetical protein [Brucepastera parasyntrophica]ULQ58870.1 hypothetical protein K7I13_10050 [Brucepastera parasyntrophica]
MKKLCILCCMLIFAVNGISASGKKEVKEITSDYSFLIGVWDIYPEVKTIEREFSWGKAQVGNNSSVIFDLIAPIPYVEIGGMGRFEIRKIEQTGNIIRITVFFDREGTDYDIVIHRIDGNKIWVETMFLFGSKKEGQIDLYKLNGSELLNKIPVSLDSNAVICHVMEPEKE